MVESKKHELKDPSKKPRVKRRRNYDEHDKEVTAEDSKPKASGKKDVKDSDESDESEDDEKLDQLLSKEDEDDDDLTEIDSTNIITGGRRTRGKVIDYKKTAEVLDKEAGKTSLPEDSEDGETSASKAPEEDEDEDDDGDFKEPEK
ncbi:Chz1p LALA0_S06e07294g [Lachancea lanzarotensis]|uniref:Histone H2A.Z-specific chaperone CHZ1 n=1 Tax=Lachancea lanzarotensis TaxID=1245769 RepID=A0A0C7MSJ0_9SACH|nr:uncharacterized protein LALA0_S06e07294g [Lachancea lanzarotensis]CEP62935.1 LALA0S06e07294g1_1 [Lachancea lanzarotensis]